MFGANPLTNWRVARSSLIHSARAIGQLWPDQVPVVWTHHPSTYLWPVEAFETSRDQRSLVGWDAISDPVRDVLLGLVELAGELRLRASEAHSNGERARHFVGEVSHG